MNPRKAIDPALIGPTLLECGARFDLTPDYHICFEPDAHLVIDAGGWVDGGTARFNHPNLWHSRCRVYELKSYLQGGGKRWRARAGISHYFVVPKEHIKLYREQGYSYVRVLINGVAARLNVSGGGSEGWTDYVGSAASISLCHSRGDLMKIAEVACSPVQIASLGLQLPGPLDADEHTRFIGLAAAAIVPGMLKAAHSRTGEAVIHLADGYSYGLSKELKVSAFKKRGRKLYCHGVIATYSQVDWVRTAELNGITFLDPAWEKELTGRKAA
ncbi:MAG: hypothetical protein WCS52_04845 [bacterium]